MGRAAALLGLVAALVAWYEAAPGLEAWSVWPSILLIALVLMPACFAPAWLALPLRDERRIVFPAGAALVALTVVLTVADLPVLANFCKLGGVVLLGWWFLGYFEALSWVVLVALVIPWVDAYSVWRGPTKHITEGQPEVFDALSVAFVVPGGGAARLGVPDVLFFAVFLAAAARFRLRPGATWIALVAGIALTMILATWLDVDGLPALPALSLGFLLPNADLLLRRRHGRREPER